MKYKQGKFTPINKSKYRGDIDNIVYRSSLELSYFAWCDNNPYIIEWNSEENIIPYFNPIDKRIHRYFVDLWMKIKDKNGKIKEFIVELKPYIYTTPDHLYNKSGKITRSNKLKKQWIVNQLKWKEAKKWAENKGMTFIILTEKDLRCQN